MSSKPKGIRTFIVHHRGRAENGCFTALGRYKVGAKTKKQAEDFLRNVIGKHCKVKVYYEDKNASMTYGEVIREC